MTETYPIVPTGPGATRQVLCQTQELMMVEFRFEKDAEGALHSHPHTQSTFVNAGRFLFFLNGEEFEIKAGDTLIIPPNAEHGCRCLEPGNLIDTFTPRRDDFL